MQSFSSAFGCTLPYCWSLTLQRLSGCKPELSEINTAALQFKEHTLTVDKSYWRIEQTFNGSNPDCDISQLMYAPVFQFL